MLINTLIRIDEVESICYWFFQYTYDLAGNQLTRTDGVTMTYDTDNRLITYAKGATSASYAYDALGRRIKKTVNGVITYFVWDDTQLIAEYSSTGVRQKRYAYLPNSLNPVQVQDVNGTYNVHSDHLDTARFLTNSAQAIVWSAKQSAFGQTTVNQDVDGNGTAVVYNLRFPGQYFDQETGLHYNYFRDYDPSIGRYIESDPIGLRGGVNTYAYALLNPYRFIDPYGLDSVVRARDIGGSIYDGGYDGYSEAVQAWQDARNASSLVPLGNMGRGESSYLGPRDAIRHCVLACSLTQRLGREKAVSILNRHEANSGEKDEMDDRNNQMGCFMGENSDPGQCQQECLNNIDFLYTSRDPDGNILPQPVPIGGR